MSDSHEAERERMVRTVASRVDDDRVLEGLESVPRRAFVPPTRRDSHPLSPIASSFQRLVEATKREDGRLERTEHGGVRFVEIR